jgi:hypothetical protein
LLALACVVYGTAFACGAGDDTTDGNRSDCSRGGPLAECAPIDPTPEGACTKLVQCGAIPEQRPPNQGFDWDDCVDRLEATEASTQTLIIACVADATCAGLRPNMAGAIPCLGFGGGL